MMNNPWLAESPSLVVLGMEKLLGELIEKLSVTTRGGGRI